MSRSAIPSSPSPSAEPSSDHHFTIAIPTFNRADWLRSCVASALSQTVESFEVVVSDNASDDATPEVLGEFDDDRLKVIRQPRNIGAIGNWNACLSAANGTYVTMLSDDDSVAPFFLARCNSLITDDRDLLLVVTLGDVFDGATGFTRPATRSRVMRSGVWQGTEILKEFLRGNISPQMCTLAIKTEALRARGGFPAGWPQEIWRAGFHCCFKVRPGSSTNHAVPTEATRRHRPPTSRSEQDSKTLGSPL